MIADKYYSAPATEIPGEGGEELGEGEEVEKETNKIPPVKFQVVGTVRSAHYKQTEDVHMIIPEDENLMEEVLRCGFIIFDISNTCKEIKKAKSILKGNDQKLF